MAFYTNTTLILLLIICSAGYLCGLFITMLGLYSQHKLEFSYLTERQLRLRVLFWPYFLFRGFHL